MFANFEELIWASKMFAKSLKFLFVHNIAEHAVERTLYVFAKFGEGCSKCFLIDTIINTPWHFKHK